MWLGDEDPVVGICSVGDYGNQGDIAPKQHPPTRVIHVVTGSCRSTLSVHVTSVSMCADHAVLWVRVCLMVNKRIHCNDDSSHIPCLLVATHLLHIALHTQHDIPACAPHVGAQCVVRRMSWDSQQHAAAGRGVWDWEEGHVQWMHRYRSHAAVWSISWHSAACAGHQPM